LHRDGETIAVRINGELKLRIRPHTLERLVCWGQVSCSPPVLALCREHASAYLFLVQGRFLARVTCPISGNVLLRRQQYRMADGDPAALPAVRAIVLTKIANGRDRCGNPGAATVHQPGSVEVDRISPESERIFEFAGKQTHQCTPQLGIWTIIVRTPASRSSALPPIVDF
jgi:CRISPR/Cas system-associated endonuclease Cas1